VCVREKEGWKKGRASFKCGLSKAPTKLNTKPLKHKQDSKNPLTSFMYRLSEAPGLHFFKNVLFVASPQDGYAPFYSARVEVHAKSLKDPKYGSVHLSMVNNLMRPLQEANVNVVRYEVHFDVQGTGLDGTIKRAAHIMLLESLAFIRHFVSMNRDYFE
jgi:hypothetical protein